MAVRDGVVFFMAATATWLFPSDASAQPGSAEPTQPPHQPPSVVHSPGHQPSTPSQGARSQSTPYSYPQLPPSPPPTLIDEVHDDFFLSMRYGAGYARYEGSGETRVSGPSWDSGGVAYGGTIEGLIPVHLII